VIRTYRISLRPTQPDQAKRRRQYTPKENRLHRRNMRDLFDDNIREKKGKRR
jgi:hypothetical protein